MLYEVITSVVILVGIFVGSYFWWIDGVLGILVSLLLFHATYSIMKDNISVLLGQKIDDELREKVLALAPEVSDLNLP